MNVTPKNIIYFYFCGFLFFSVVFFSCKVDTVSSEDPLADSTIEDETLDTAGADVVGDDTLTDDTSVADPDSDFEEDLAEEEPEPACVDVDNDGYSGFGDGCVQNAPDYDCNEQSNQVFPGALELCDGLDNDCDGIVDEEIEGCCNPGESRPCGSDIGNCSPGTQHCGSDRAWDECIGRILPALEECNNQDDDCNGETDEGDDGPLTQSCYTGPEGTERRGICHTGIQTCVNGLWSSCEGEQTPLEIELCNNEDDDCDGTVDNDPEATICQLDNSNAVCTSGICEITECLDQFGDCDSEAENGCERDYRPLNGHCCVETFQVFHRAGVLGSGVSTQISGMSGEIPSRHTWSIHSEHGELMGEFFCSEDWFPVADELQDDNCWLHRISTDQYFRPPSFVFLPPYIMTLKFECTGGEFSGLEIGMGRSISVVFSDWMQNELRRYNFVTATIEEIHQDRVPCELVFRVDEIYCN